MVCCIVLSGGLSKRFRENSQGVRDKALYKIGSLAMLEHVLEKTETICGDRDTVVSVRDRSQALFYKKTFSGRDLLYVEDLYRPGGPLAGLYSSLRYCRSDTVLVLPNDTPFVSTGLLRDIVRLAQRGYHIVSPVLPNTVVEYLVAASDRSVLERYLRILVERFGRTRASDLHRGAATLYLLNTERHGYSYRELLNINTERDLFSERIPRRVIDSDIVLERPYSLEDIERGLVERLDSSLWTTLATGDYCRELELYIEKKMFYTVLQVLREDPGAWRLVREAWDLIEELLWEPGTPRP